MGIVLECREHEEKWLEKGQGTAPTPTRHSLGILFSLNNQHLSWWINRVILNAPI